MPPRSPISARTKSLNCVMLHAAHAADGAVHEAVSLGTDGKDVGARGHELVDERLTWLVQHEAMPALCEEPCERWPDVAAGEGDECYGPVGCVQRRSFDGWVVRWYWTRSAFLGQAWFAGSWYYQTGCSTPAARSAAAARMTAPVSVDR